MTDKPRTMEVDGDKGKEIAMAMSHLSDVTEEIVKCYAYGAILVDMTGHMTLLVHPKMQQDPARMREFLDRLRECCDMYDRVFVKNKVQ